VQDAFTLNALSQLNDIETEIVTYIERQFLKTLEGGCTAPIGALAIYDDEDTIHFQGVLFSLDGKEKMQIDKTVPIEEWKKLGFYSAQEILNNGGTKLMTEIKNNLKNNRAKQAFYPQNIVEEQGKYFLMLILIF
jgi:hydroxymethylbilane synthase